MIGCLQKFMLLASLCVLTSGCVHEFPEFSGAREFAFSITHDSRWNEVDFDIKSKTRSDGEWRSRYLFKVFPAGVNKIPSYEYEYISDDSDVRDFSIPMQLPQGDWDVYVWGDKVRDDFRFHNASGFEAIRYTGDYHGAHDMRETFEGMTSVSIGANGMMRDDVYGITLHRPQGKYVFIATNLREFTEQTLKGDINSLEDYSIVGIYPLFMPSAYNLFTKRIIDSSRGITYNNVITPIDDDNALLAFDHVFMNDGENAVQVQIALQAPDGSLHSLTSTLTIPIRRSQTTIVRGDFLKLPSGSGGVKIDITFSGEFNIEI